MKEKFHPLLVLLVCLCIQAKSQTLLPANTIITQNFNGIGASGTAALPADWKFSGAGNGAAATWAGINTVATTQGASGGTPVAGGAYNWGTAAGADRSIGFMTSASYAAPNAIMAYYRNTTGTTVTTVTISYSVERYRVNTGACSLAFFSSINGSTWTAQNAGDISAGVFLPGGSSYTFSNPQAVTKTVVITGLSIANNADIYFRWVFTTTGTTTSQGIGLDDVAVFAGSATPVMSADLNVALTGDVTSDGQANAGDKLTYTATIKNSGSGAVAGVNYSNTIPTNTTLTGTIKTSALARDDQYTTPANTILNGSTVLANDFGVPAVTVVSFGAIGNPVTLANGSNTTPTEGGGTVLMNVNGTFTYTPAAGFTGVDRFAYIASSGTQPDNDAIVSITVGSAVNAVNDSYSVIGNVSITLAAGAGILSNDPGDNKALLSVNGSAANIGGPITTAQGGTLTVNANGSFTYDPPAGYEGSDQFTYSIDNAFAAPATATVTLNISGMIWFVNNNVGTNGSGKLSSPFNSLNNFQAVNNGTGNNPAANDNIFLYESGTSYDGSVTLLNGQKLIGQDAAATLATITGLSVPSYSAALPVTDNGNATLVTLVATTAATNPINLIAAASNTIRGFTIGNNTGSGISGTGFGTLTVAEVAKNGTGNAITVNGGTINGTFTNITTTSGTVPLSFTNISGALTVNAGSISGNTGTGLLISGSAGNFTFTNLPITNPGGTAFQVAGGNGTIAHAGTISKNNAGRLLDLQSRTGGSITISGNLSSTSTSTGILVQNNTGGSITLSGSSKVLNTGASTPLTIQTNTGAVVNITGGLALTSTTAMAMNVSGGGTVTVTGTGNTISNGNGGALSVVNTTIGAGNLNFQSIASNGAINGILLNNTGAGGLVVTGTGTAGTGGTIQNCTQRGARFILASNISLSYMTFTGNGTANIDAAATAGDALNGTNTNVAAGIDLQTVSGFSASNVTITGGAQMGLNGKGVSNLVLTNCSVQNTGDEVLEDGVQLVNLSGTCTVTNSSFTGNFHRQFEVQNSTGNLNLSMTGCTFDHLSYVSTGGQGMLLVGHTSAVIVASIKSSLFKNNFGTAFTGQVINNGNVTITLGSNGLANIPAEGNTFTDNSGAIQMLSDNAGALNYGIGNNGITVSAVVTSGFTPVTFRKGTNATGFVGGTFGFNTIGNAAVANSGTNAAGINGLSITNEGLSGGMNITVSNNTIQRVSQRGMEVLLQLNDNLNVAVLNNTFQNPNPSAVPGNRVGHAIFMQSGTDAADAGTLCAEIQNNSISGAWDDITSGNIRVRMFPTGGSDKFRIRNLATGTAAAVVTFLNTTNAGAVASATTPTAYLTGAAACF
ncbi:hypothetical protein D3H65_05725 [Paraflavitalea soli]|uniref:DUF11 domain-containing protein n=1 Tax=Paraflavitalea soli TaxID=2315862 RepID=A0A3B7MPL6_9BACT|nr:Ig-like domain-containing protein [Paraflavitalea soli]AXY73505.1 hypothetical protein D3H65_05725 [Paraflavitalea soli]